MTMTKAGVYDEGDTLKQAPVPKAQPVAGKNAGVATVKPASPDFGKGAVAPEPAMGTPYGPYSDPGDTARK